MAAYGVFDPVCGLSVHLITFRLGTLPGHSVDTVQQYTTVSYNGQHIPFCEKPVDCTSMDRLPLESSRRMWDGVHTALAMVFFSREICRHITGMTYIIEQFEIFVVYNGYGSIGVLLGFQQGQNRQHDKRKDVPREYNPITRQPAVCTGINAESELKGDQL